MTSRCTLDGVAVDAVPPEFALQGYGTFTTFVADDGAVLGWPLHAERLTDGTATLWGHRLDRVQLDEAVRAHLGDEPGPATVRVTLFPASFNLAAPEDADGVRVLVTSTPTTITGQPTPDLTVQTVASQRDPAHLKSTNLLPVLALRRDARLAGHDDALLCTTNELLEGTTWSVVLWRGDEVATPGAGVLPSTTVTHLEQVAADLGRALVRRPVLRSELATADLVLAVSVNHPARAIVRVDGQALTTDRDLQTAVAAGYAGLVRERV